MLREYEYHIISFFITAINVGLFWKNIDCTQLKWTWDWVHLYFLGLVIYCLILVSYALRIYFLCGKLDLKNFPAENISLAKEHYKKIKVHPYAAFERKDLVNMKLGNLLYGTIFMSSWKLILIVFFTTSNLTVCLMVSLLLQFSKNEWHNSRVLRFYGLFLRRICRISLWLLGVNRIENNYLCDKEWPKNIVSNHVSALDIFYFISEQMCSFVAKKSLRKDRFIGASAQSLRCVFVYREKSEDRKKALESIKERQILVNDKKEKYPSFVVFSEGTTSNGFQIIEQKKGAFFSLIPITPVLLIYDFKYFNPSYDILPFTWWLFLSTTTYESLRLRTYWLPQVDPPTGPEYDHLTDEDKINIFHDKVSKIMFANMKKYNPKSPQDIDDYREWPGSLRIKLEYFQNALGKVAMKHLKKEKKLSEKS